MEKTNDYNNKQFIKEQSGSDSNSSYKEKEEENISLAREKQLDYSFEGCRDFGWTP